jgi:hypothetical protein
MDMKLTPAQIFDLIILLTAMICLGSLFPW